MCKHGQDDRPVVTKMAPSIRGHQAIPSTEFSSLCTPTSPLSLSPFPLIASSTRLAIQPLVATPAPYSGSATLGNHRCRSGPRRWCGIFTETRTFVDHHIDEVEAFPELHTAINAMVVVIKSTTTDRKIGRLGGWHARRKNEKRR
jgi:hypothetical protein